MWCSMRRAWTSAPSKARWRPSGRRTFSIIGGTSLAVYPAAGLIQYYRGSRLVLINKSATPCDRQADLVIHAPIGALLEQIQVRP